MYTPSFARVLKNKKARISTVIGIVPGARWNLLPPGTFRRSAYTAT